MKCNVVPCTLNDKPFIFISYAHSDASLVFPVLEGIAVDGYNIWYDHGIEVNTTWSDEIANAILASEIAVVFITKDSMASHYVRAEVEFAISKNVGVVPVYLEGTDVMPPGLSMALLSTQGIESNDIGEIVSKLRKWLMQNVKKENLQHVEPYITVISEPPPAKDEQPVKPLIPVVASELEDWQPVKSSISVAHEPRKEETVSKVGEVEENYWRSGLYGNKEEYEKYLLIKNSLGKGKNRTKIKDVNSAHAVSSRPYMAMLLGIIFLVNVTEIFHAYVNPVYVNWGIHQHPFVMALLSWGLPSVIFYWFFFRRDTSQASFFDNLLPMPQMFQSLLYWSFLLGWLAYALEPEHIKTWLPYISRALAFVRINWNVAALMSMNLPQAPHAIQYIGSLALVISGALLVLDVVASAVMSFFTEKD